MTETDKQIGGETCPQIDMNVPHGPAGSVSTADRSVNKHCGTSERCEQDCAKELRMYCTAWRPFWQSYKDMMGRGEDTRGALRVM